MNDLLTIHEVCEFFGGSGKPLDPSTIYRWVRLKKIPPPIRMTALTQRWRLSDCQLALDAMATASQQRSAQ